MSVQNYFCLGVTINPAEINFEDKMQQPGLREVLSRDDAEKIMVILMNILGNERPSTGTSDKHKIAEYHDAYVNITNMGLGTLYYGEEDDDRRIFLHINRKLTDYTNPLTVVTSEDLEVTDKHRFLMTKICEGLGISVKEPQWCFLQYECAY